MNKIVCNFWILTLLLCVNCKDNAASKINSENVAIAAKRDASAHKLPEINFDKTEHDFGNLVSGTPVETKFKYTNIGTSMLVVSNIKSSCGCTVPQDYQKEVAPGETAEFTVKFNGSGNGKITKTLTMTTNTEKGNEQVKITAFIEPNPNAPVKKAGKSNITPITSSKPGHEGHNHN